MMSACCCPCLPLQANSASCIVGDARERRCLAERGREADERGGGLFLVYDSSTPKKAAYEARIRPHWGTE